MTHEVVLLYISLYTKWNDRLSQTIVSIMQNHDIISDNWGIGTKIIFIYTYLYSLKQIPPGYWELLRKIT